MTTLITLMGDHIQIKFVHLGALGYMHLLVQSVICILH